MLLEYNEDTNEETMHDRALQLRHRVAARKLNEAIDKNQISVDGLLFMRDKNREARKNHGTDELELTEVEVKERVALARSDQHFKAERQVTTLAKDVARASRLSKAKLDSLIDLEKRIMNMRGQLHAPNVKQVDSVIAAELQTNNKLVRLEGKFEICSVCSRRILQALMPTHAKVCAIQEQEKAERKISNLPGPEGVSDLNINVVTSLATFKPQPPRNIEIKEIGISFIEWKWEPPVIDGGLEIIDYEISYQARFSVFNRDIGKFKKWEEDVPSLRTSSWIFRDKPVCSNGFKIMGLRADTEYCQFKIRSLNLRGWSEWVPMIQPSDIIPFPLVKTLSSVSPTCPLFVTCDDVTSSCIHLSWSPPLFDGGVPIIEYIVHYTVVELVITVTERDKKLEKKKEFCTESTDCAAVIRHIPDDTDVIDIYVVARNYDLRLGDKGYVKLPKDKKCIRTKPSSRHSRLLRELEYASNVTDDHIDSAFFTGIKQRYLRVEHLRKLKEELSVTPPDPLEVEEAKEWAAVEERTNMRKQMEEEALRLALELEAKDKAAKADEDAMNKEHGDLGFTYQQRREQFDKKIKSLEARLVQLTNERSEIDKKRIYATSQMRAKEKRMRNLQVEKERLKDYTGTAVTSNVLVGADMQYNIVDFRKRVDVAVDECMKDIAAWKFAVITGENRRQQIKIDLQTTEEQRKERMAKFYEFESNFQKTMKIMKKFNRQDADEKIKLLYFRYLQRHRDERLALRAKIAATFQQVVRRYLKIAFHKWKTGENDMSSQNTRAHRSVGGILLQRALEKREELQGLLRATISDTAAIKQKLELSTLSKETRRQLQQSRHFKHTEEGIDHQKLFKDKGLSLLYEGDAYAQENKFALAAQCYEGQILLIRTAGRIANLRQKQLQHQQKHRKYATSQSQTDVKGLAICHGRLGRMYAKMGNASRAIVEFDRQLSLAREIDDKAEESDAYYGLGAGYYQNYDYDNAIRYMSIAQAQYVSLGRIQRYILTLKLLKECYFRLNKPDKVAVYEEKLKDAESSANQKLLLMHQRLDDMKNKLTHNAAEIELVVHIERTTYRALELRKLIAGCDVRVKELDAEIEAQEATCLEIVALLEAIQKELTEAVNTDAPEMWSALVHDQPQVVEIEELKTRLKQRLVVETKRLDTEREVKKTLLVRLKNVENDIVEADQQLVLEDGALMKHARLDRSFRCVGLCAANVSGNEVTGTATGGYEEFVASEGHNIHVIDYHSGELLHMFLGGNSDTGHVGIVTCLLHDGAYIFSGATDETIVCWDSVQRTMLRKLMGHEGSIVALASESRSLLISAAADTTMRLWEKHTGQLLRVVFGHAKSVLSMEIGPTWLLTGSADCEVRVWKIYEKETMQQRQQSANLWQSSLEKITPDSDFAPQLDLLNIPAPPPLPALPGSKAELPVVVLKGKAKQKKAEQDARDRQAKEQAMKDVQAMYHQSNKRIAVGKDAATLAMEDYIRRHQQQQQKEPQKHRHHHKKQHAAGHPHRLAFHNVQVECTVRLVGHEAPITCVKYGNMEVLSGDVLGRVFIWWLATGSILRKCQVHRGPVKSLQFDSVHIVSGGMDAAVAITDIATGEPLQSLRGHEKSVLALAFDSERIVSVGGDNTIRYWQWGKKAGPQDKLHILGPGETLAMIAKQFQITVDNLMKWNGITESRQCHPGMKLIVKKGDPNALTQAETVAAERELRRARGRAWATKKLANKDTDIDDDNEKRALAKRYNRVKTLAMDQDPFSLNNRLFGREKRQLELFPDTTLDRDDEYSLAARIAVVAEASQNATGDTVDVESLRQSRLQKKLHRTVRYFISVDNEDEWGDVAEQLGHEMLEMLVELMAYECVIEAKNAQRSKFSVMGRISIHQEERHRQELLAKQKEEEEKEREAKAKEEQEEQERNATLLSHETGALPTLSEHDPRGEERDTLVRDTSVSPPAAAVVLSDAEVKRRERHRANSLAEQRKKERKEQRQQKRKSLVQSVRDDAEQQLQVPAEEEGQIVHSHRVTTQQQQTTTTTGGVVDDEAAAVEKMIENFTKRLVLGSDGDDNDDDDDDVAQQSETHAAFARDTADQSKGVKLPKIV